jgi:hypothetical protein
MVTRAETLQKVCGLLEETPGISVPSSALDAECARISVSLCSAATVGALQRLALAANVRVSPRVEQPGDGDGDALRQVIVANTSARDGLFYGELQMLGIHLAWHLHAAGILDDDRANALLRPWGAAPVGG